MKINEELILDKKIHSPGFIYDMNEKGMTLLSITQLDLGNTIASITEKSPDIFWRFQSSINLKSNYVIYDLTLQFTSGKLYKVRALYNNDVRKVVGIEFGYSGMLTLIDDLLRQFFFGDKSSVKVNNKQEIRVIKKQIKALQNRLTNLEKVV